MNHGGPTSANRHVGDLGNIASTTATGTTLVSITDSLISLMDGNAANILNRAIVVHEDPDDLSDVTSAGARISCGVIQACDATCQETFAI